MRLNFVVTLSHSELVELRMGDGYQIKNLNTYYVSILKCSDDSYYVGVTNNLDTRISQHDSGIDKIAYTYNKGPLLLVFHETFNDINQAIAREKHLKGWSRKKKEVLINNNIELLKEFSKNNQ